MSMDAVSVFEVESITVVRARVTDQAGVDALARELGGGEPAHVVVDLGPSGDVEGLGELLATVCVRRGAGLPFAVVAGRESVREQLRAVVPGDVVFESLDIAVGDLAAAQAPVSPAEHTAPPRYGLDARGD